MIANDSRPVSLSVNQRHAASMVCAGLGLKPAAPSVARSNPMAGASAREGFQLAK